MAAGRLQRPGLPPRQLTLQPVCGEAQPQEGGQGRAAGRSWNTAVCLKPHFCSGSELVKRKCLSVVSGLQLKCVL